MRKADRAINYAIVLLAFGAFVWAIGRFYDWLSETTFFILHPELSRGIFGLVALAGFWLVFGVANRWTARRQTLDDLADRLEEAERRIAQLEQRLDDTEEAPRPD